MLTIAEITERLQELDPFMVAFETGLGLSTVYKYRAGNAKSPPLETVRVLSDYLTSKEAA